MLTKFLAFGILGIFGSLIYTAARSSIEKKRFEPTGEASLILFPAWGLISIVYPIIAIRIGSLAWYYRGLIFVIAFYVFQYGIGYLLNRFDLCPWRYKGGGSFNGFIRINDAPIWFISGLLVEWLYPMVKMMGH